MLISYAHPVFIFPEDTEKSHKKRENVVYAGNIHFPDIA